MIFRFPNRAKGGEDRSAPEGHRALLPLRDIVVFPSYGGAPVHRPGAVHPRPRTRHGAGEVYPALHPEGARARTSPGKGEIHRVGTLATILQMLRLPDGTVKVLVEGKAGPRSSSFCQPSFSRSRRRNSRRPGRSPPETRGPAPLGDHSFETYTKLNKKVPQEAFQTVAAIDDPGRLADSIAGHLAIKSDEKQGCWKSWTRAAPGVRAHPDQPGKRDPPDRKPHQEPGQKADGKDPAGVLPQRTDAGHPEGDGGKGGSQGRNPGAGTAHHRRSA